MQTVSGCRLLIAEDEYLLASDLARFFSGLGANVLGPAPSLKAAKRHASEAEAAILDVDLDGEAIFPLADDLLRRGVPFVFFSGRSDIVLPARFRHMSYLTKPLAWEAVADALFGKAGAPERDAEDVLSILPRLRLSARLMLNDAAAADRVVELALERSIAHLSSRPDDMALDLWLGQMLQEAADRYGKDVMN